MKALHRFLRILLMAFGGAILALAMLVLFAWLLFPADFVRRLPEKALSRVLPQWQWQIGGVQYDWPFVLRLEQVEARAKNQGAGAAEPIHVDRLTIRPDVVYFIRGRQWRGSFAAELAGGSINGSGALHMDADQQNLAVSATIDAVNLAGLGWLSQVLERQVRGRLSGTIDTHLALKNAMPAGLRATLQVADGDIPLRNPVLGHEHLPFSKLTLQLEQNGQNLMLDNGVLDSPLCNGAFAGTLTLAQPIAASTVSVRGTIQARPELFQHVREQKELQTLRLQAAQGPLFVMLSGTLNDPALAFERETQPFNSPQTPNQEQSLAP